MIVAVRPVATQLQRTNHQQVTMRQIKLGRKSRTSHREKEKRKKVIRLSLMKLHLIEDPESRLRRSVLINNTFRSLQQEHTRDRQGGETQHQPTHTTLSHGKHGQSQSVL